MTRGAAKPDPVLARIHTPKAHLKGRPVDMDDVTLFFPYDRVNRPWIGCWARIGQHSEAGGDYMLRKCYPAKTTLELAAVAAALAQYAKECPDFPVRQVHRVPLDRADKAWRD